MVVADIGKMVLIGALVGSVTLLAALSKLDGSVVKDFLLLAGGYLFGNGANAVRKAAPSPVLTTSQTRLEHDAATNDTAG